MIKPAWRKSTYSNGENGSCVEVGSGDGAIRIRDTKNRDGATLTTTPESWAGFLTAVKESTLTP